MNLCNDLAAFSAYNLEVVKKVPQSLGQKIQGLKAYYITNYSGKLPGADKNNMFCSQFWRKSKFWNKCCNLIDSAVVDFQKLGDNVKRFIPMWVSKRHNPSTLYTGCGWKNYLNVDMCHRFRSHKPDSCDSI